jgi:hypothetical protein
MSGQASLGSMPRDHGLKNWSHLLKSLDQQTEQGFDPSGQIPRMTLSSAHDARGLEH